VDLKGGSDALKAMLGGSADVVSGYFDHCVISPPGSRSCCPLSSSNRYPGLVLVVSPKHMDEIKSIKDLAAESFERGLLRAGIARIPEVGMACPGAR